MQKQKNIIIGIDPGTAITGYSLLEKVGSKISLLKYGCIKTSSKLEMPTRLKKIDEELAQIIKEYRPTVMSIEKLFFSQNVTTAMAVAQARGVALLSSAKANIKAFEYTPQQVKLAVCGYGKADKKQVQEMTKRILKLAEIPRPDDAADAIAIAICHLNTNSTLLQMIGKK
jgi:crossover junction endodeoxyribonuclease RuvC